MERTRKARKVYSASRCRCRDSNQILPYTSPQRANRFGSVSITAPLSRRDLYDMTVDQELTSSISTLSFFTMFTRARQQTLLQATSNKVTCSYKTSVIPPVTSLSDPFFFFVRLIPYPINRTFPTHLAPSLCDHHSIQKRVPIMRFLRDLVTSCHFQHSFHFI